MGCVGEVCVFVSSHVCKLLNGIVGILHLDARTQESVGSPAPLRISRLMKEKITVIELHQFTPLKGPSRLRNPIRIWRRIGSGTRSDHKV
jgi:hypothetical protein